MCIVSDILLNPGNDSCKSATDILHAFLPQMFCIRADMRDATVHVCESGCVYLD